MSSLARTQEFSHDFPMPDLLTIRENPSDAQEFQLFVGHMGLLVQPGCEVSVNDLGF